MKKVLLLFCLITITFSAKAQVWAPLGATWHYEVSELFNGNISYVEVISIGDTIIQGKNCKILWTDWVMKQSNEYTYMDSNLIVYHYNSEYAQFYPIYNFNANVGDHWTEFAHDRCDGDSTVEIRVESVDSISINSHTLKTFGMQYYEAGSNYYVNGSDSVIEWIGSANYLFPLTAADSCDGIFPSYYEGPYFQLRCYNDSTIGLYETGISPSCDYTSIKDISLNENKVKIYPNPSSSELNIEMENFSNSNYSVEIYSSIGQKLSSRRMNEKLISLNTDNLANGSYLVLVRKENGEVGFSKLVEVNHN